MKDRKIFDDSNWASLQLEGLPTEVIEHLEKLRAVAGTHHLFVLVRDALLHYEQHLRQEFPDAASHHLDEE